MSFSCPPFTVFPIRARTALCAGWLAALLLAGLPARAHICDYPDLTIEQGNYEIFLILADVEEEEPSDYQINDAGNASIVRIVNPGIPFSALGFGAWSLKAGAIGTTTLEFMWSYQVMSGTCSVEITVVAPGSAPGGPAGFATPLPVGDPVDTVTGALFEKYHFGADLGGPFPLRLAFYYDSSLRRNWPGISRLGNNWQTNWDLSLLHDTVDQEVTVAFEYGRVLRFAQNASDWELQSPSGTPFQLVQSPPNGADWTLLDPATNRFFDFHDDGKLAKVRDGKGNEHALSYSGPLLMSVSDGLGRDFNFSYSSFHDLSSVSYTGGRSIGLSPGFTGGRSNLAAITDARGNTTSFGYDGADVRAGRLVSWQRPEMNVPYTQTWTGSRVATQTDALSNTNTLSYGANSTSVLDPAGGTTTVDTAPGVGLVGVTDPASNALSVGHDGSGRTAQLVSRENRTSSYTYHAGSGRIASMTGPTGETTALSYTMRSVGAFTLYDLTRIDHDDGTFESYGYDASGNATSATDRAGGNWGMSYDGRGQMLTRTNPFGGMEAWSWNANGTLATHTDAATNVVTYGYDSALRRNTIGYPGGASIGFNWDANDNLTSYTNELGLATQFGYDLNDNLRVVIDPNTQAELYGYDALDRLDSATDRAGNTRELEYDALGRVEIVRDAALGETMYGRDALGGVINILKPSTGQVGFTRDREANITGFSDALSRERTLTTDDYGRVVRYDTPTFAGFTVGWNPAGDYASYEDPLGVSANFGYHATGRLTSLNAGAGISASFTRNAAGQLTGSTDPNGESWSWGYDLGGRLVMDMDPNGGTTTIGYDTRNRVATRTTPEESETRAYDDAGNLTSRSFASGLSLSYDYDFNDRLKLSASLNLDYDEDGRITDSNGIVNTYEGGLLKTATLAPGKTVTYDYDADRRLRYVTDWTGDMTMFGYDASGLRTSISRPNGVTTTLAYDSLGRLGALSHGSHWASNYSYDDADQIIGADRSVEATATPAPVQHTFTRDAAGQVTGAGYAQDGDGRLTMKGAWSLSYDGADRLTQADDGQTTIDFGYDGLGYLVSKTEGATTTAWAMQYGTEKGVPAVERVNGADTRYMVHTPSGELLYDRDATTDERRDYHFDERGNTVLLTNPVAAILSAYLFSPFGLLLAQTGPLTPYGYLGQQAAITIAQLGLVFLNGRFYDPEIASFVTRNAATLFVAGLASAYMNPWAVFSALANSGFHSRHYDREDVIDDLLDFEYDVGSRRAAYRAGMNLARLGDNAGKKILPIWRLFFPGLRPLAFQPTIDPRLLLALLLFLGPDFIGPAMPALSLPLVIDPSAFITKVLTGVPQAVAFAGELERLAQLRTARIKLEPRGLLGGKRPMTGMPTTNPSRPIDRFRISAELDELLARGF